jgi:rSAM/selenodomain-associated transferase 1
VSGVIAVFAKPPGSPQAKTRLASTLGRTTASAFAHALLRDTWQAATASGVRCVVATTDIGGHFGFPCEAWDQGTGDLGERLAGVLRRALDEASWAIALGADSPGLPRATLRKAVALLARHDAVLGRARDGGFYLLGVRRCPEGLFDGIPWSTERAGDVMQTRLESAGMRPVLLPEWFDIDTEADLEHFQVSASPEEAPATWALLHALGRTGRRSR